MFSTYIFIHAKKHFFGYINFFKIFKNELNIELKRNILCTENFPEEQTVKKVEN